MKSILKLLALILWSLIANAAELSGTVKTQSGEPLSDVYVHFGRSMNAIIKTDEKGKFSFATSSKVIFFRRVGYQPLTKIIDTVVTEIDVVMLGSDATEIVLKSCAPKISKDKLVGRSFILKVPDDAKSVRGFDVDYGYFSISKKFGKEKKLLHGI